MRDWKYLLRECFRLLAPEQTFEESLFARRLSI